MSPRNPARPSAQRPGASSVPRSPLIWRTRVTTGCSGRCPSGFETTNRYDGRSESFPYCRAARGVSCKPATAREADLAYSHRFYITECGACKARWLHTRNSRGHESLLPISFLCTKCNHRNMTGKVSPVPDVPRLLYCGHERHKQLEVYPFPIDQIGKTWALPFSVRSVIYQASRQLGGCIYDCSEPRHVLGEPAYSDHCFEPHEDWEPEPHVCHMLSGWTRGNDSCDLWELIQQFCQTDSEKKFLRQYLSYAKGRNFPMLLPQPRIGIAERRRPDFVLFVPLQYYKYKRYAIELDGAHSEATSDVDKLRDEELAKEGYTVLSLRPSERGYLEEVRKLVEKVEAEMNTADTQDWDSAIEVSVVKTFEEQDIPF
jgi:hypothetical protein